MTSSPSLAEQLRDLLRQAAEGRAPIEAVDEWFQRHESVLRSDASVGLKTVVQDALVHAWSWRQRHRTEHEARASLRALADRLSSGSPV